jgi:hypothetical protein
MVKEYMAQAGGRLAVRVQVQQQQQHWLAVRTAGMLAIRSSLPKIY